MCQHIWVLTSVWLENWVLTIVFAAVRPILSEATLSVFWQPTPFANRQDITTFESEPEEALGRIVIVNAQPKAQGPGARPKAQPEAPWPTAQTHSPRSIRSKAPRPKPQGPSVGSGLHSDDLLLIYLNPTNLVVQ